MKTNAEVCEEAHNRLLKDPKILGGLRHSYYNRHSECLEYTKVGQSIFNYYQEQVEREYNIN